MFYLYIALCQPDIKVFIPICYITAMWTFTAHKVIGHGINTTII